MVGSVPDESADGGEEPPGSEVGGGDGGVEAGLGSSGDDFLPLRGTGRLAPGLENGVGGGDAETLVQAPRHDVVPGVKREHGMAGREDRHTLNRQALKAGNDLLRAGMIPYLNKLLHGDLVLLRDRLK